MTTGQPTSLRARKQALRARVRALAPAVEARRGPAGRALAAYLACFEPWTRARRVALFVGVAPEPDTMPVLAAAWASGCEVWLPRVRARAPEPAMDFVHVTGPGHLVPGAFGLLEPPPDAAGRALAEVEPDLVAVPGLAFARDGGRLGRGLGFYDRALAPLGDRAVRVGLALEALVFDDVPCEAHDARMGWLATEAGIVPCTRAG